MSHWATERRLLPARLSAERLEWHQWLEGWEACEQGSTGTVLLVNDQGTLVISSIRTFQKVLEDRLLAPVSLRACHGSLLVMFLFSITEFLQDE